MKLTIDAIKLRDALALNVAEKKSTSPVYEHALFDVAGLYEMGKLSITTTNAQEQLSISVACYNNEFKALAINPIELKNALTGLKGDVDLQLIDGQLSVCQKTKRGVRKFKLNYLPADNFPLYDKNKVIDFKFDAETLKLAIGCVRYAAAKQDIRYYLNAVNIGKTCIAATDGIRMAIYALDIENEHELLIPVGCVDRLLKLLNKASDILLKLYLNLDNKPIALSVENDAFNYIIKLVQGRFPDVMRAVPNGVPNSIIELNCDDVLPVIERDILFETIKVEKSFSSRLDLKFKDNLVKITGKMTNDHADCTASKPAECALDGKYLCDVLRLGKEQDVTWKVFDNRQAYIFDFGKSDIHLIQPMVMQ